MKKLIILFYLVILLCCESCLHFPFNNTIYYKPLGDSVVVEKYCNEAKSFIMDLFKNHKNYYDYLLNNTKIDCKNYIDSLRRYSKNEKSFNGFYITTFKSELDEFFNNVDSNNIINIDCTNITLNDISDISCEVETNDCSIGFAFKISNSITKPDLVLANIGLEPESQSPNKVKYDTAFINECFEKAKRFVSKIMENPKKYLEIINDEKEIDCLYYYKKILIEYNKKDDLNESFKEISNYKLIYKYPCDLVWDKKDKLQDPTHKAPSKIIGFCCRPVNNYFVDRVYDFPIFCFEINDNKESFKKIILWDIGFLIPKSDM